MNWTGGKLLTLTLSCQECSFWEAFQKVQYGEKVYEKKTANIRQHLSLKFLFFVSVWGNFSSGTHSFLLTGDIFSDKGTYPFLSTYLPIYLWLYSLLLDLGCFFSSLIFYTVGRTPWSGDQAVVRPLPAHMTAQTQNKRIQTSMRQVGFEHTITVWASEDSSCLARPLWSSLFTDRKYIFWQR
jgi:hypothetical protein